MRHGSLFSGIGGFDLAAQWMGYENVFHCEWNPFCKQVLKYHFPNSISYDDITKTDFTIHRRNIDILTGGFPCQPYSVAGKRKGKDDDRHLWPEMLRAIREIQPSYVVGENVRGITNWNGGMVFDEVQADLENENYEVLPFLLPACAVNAPHRRDRIWFIAYSNSNREIVQGRNRNSNNKERNSTKKIQKRQDEFIRIEQSNSENEFIAHSDSIGQPGSGSAKGQIGSAKKRNWEASWFNANGRWPTQSPICDGDDGFPSRLDTTSISKKQWTEQSLQAGGNAIVPQIALELFKAIEKFNSEIK